MRRPGIAGVAAALVCGACAVQPDPAPREYLDERTAATITVVADPWIFSRERTLANDQRDFLHIYAVDVNRMGDHRQYLAVLQSLPLVDPGGRELPPPQLRLSTGEGVISLQPSAQDPRDIGLAQPVAESYTPTSKWWYYPVDKQALARIAMTRNVQAALAAAGVETAYEPWRDGRDEIVELTSVLP